MNGATTSAGRRDDLQARNRRLLLVLLGIIGTLLVAGFLVGIRW